VAWVTKLSGLRWRTDSAEAAVDPNADGNDFSFYYRSRMDVHRSSGAVFDCEDLRTGCPGLVTDDGYSGSFDYYSYDTTPDAGPTASLPEAPYAVLIPAVGLLGLGAVALCRRRRG